MFAKLIIFGVLFLDVIGISIIIPAFPELKAYYQISDFQVTLGLTLYSACAFFATPRLGQISDKYGRKKPLLRCVIGTCLSYLLLLVTPSYWIFLLSRMINGITGGNISVIQAILTDISPDQATKTKHYGWMGALFGVGFIIGPLIGSLILQFGHVEYIFRFGALFACIEVVLLMVHFHDTHIPIVDKKIRIDTIALMWSYLRQDRFKYLLWSMILLGTGGFLINSTQSLYMHTWFGFSGAQYGYFLAFAGLIAAFNMGFLIPKFWTQIFTSKTLIRISHIVLIVGYSIIGMTSSTIGFIVVFYLTVLLSGAYATVYNVAIMGQAQDDAVGTLAGVLGGLQSLVMVLGPLCGGLLMAGGYNIFAGAVVCFVISLIIMLRYLLTKSS